MNKQGKVNFAVVGQGHIGKRHGEMIRRNDKANLVAVCDIKPLDELNLAVTDTPFYSSLHEMLEKHPEIEVVNICTPNGLHTQQASQALDSKKHVVIEKPIALTKNDAEKIVYRSLNVGKHVFCVMQNRFSPPSVWLKDIISNKRLGNIYKVQVNCYWNRDERYYKPGNWHGDATLDGGTLFTQFSHFIDIIYWLFGDITNIKGVFNDYSHQKLTDFEDSGIVTFDFIEGGSGVLNYSTAVYDSNLESSITILGEEGTVKVSGQYMNQLEYCNIKGYEAPELAESGPANDYGGYKGSAQNHHYVIENVVEKLRSNGTISTNAMEGLKVVDIIERIYAERDKTFSKLRH